MDPLLCITLLFLHNLLPFLFAHWRHFNQNQPATLSLSKTKPNSRRCPLKGVKGHTLNTVATHQCREWRRCNRGRRIWRKRDGQKRKNTDFWDSIRACATVLGEKGMTPLHRGQAEALPLLCIAPASRMALLIYFTVTFTLQHLHCETCFYQHLNVSPSVGLSICFMKCVISVLRFCFEQKEIWTSTLFRGKIIQTVFGLMYFLSTA